MQVYRIFNKINGKSYIGITKWSFNERYPQGKWWKWTHNNHLISAVEKYGLNNFDVEILYSKIDDVSHLLELEESFIKIYNSFVPNGYNLTKGGGKINPTNIKEYELIDRHGNLHKISNLSKFCRNSKLNYGAMLNMVSGINNSSQGFALSSTPIEKISYKDNTGWDVENISTKETSHIDDTIEWCKLNNVEIRPLRRMLQGKTKVVKNWKLISTILNESYRGADTKYKNITLINSQNKEIIINNIYRFCMENNLDRGGMYKLIRGKSLVYKGYRLPCNENEFKEKQSKRLGKIIKIVSPNKEIIEIKNISDFCRKNKLNRNNFQCLVSKKIKSYKGWEIYE